jgi:hypothetical protein
MTLLLLVLGIICAFAAVPLAMRAAPPSNSTEPQVEAQETRVSVAAARQQAEVLHETLHATLQIVHHQYYREDEGLAIPAATLRKVFDEVARRRKVEIRWLAVNAEAMNIEHSPRDAFERDAVAALAAGKEAHETVADGIYRRAGAITLTSDCLKCHLPNRTSTEDRAAGLLISIPVEEKIGP